ncbi:hypothetical protein AXF42_Ash013105 [Apostasia shenzhenica]|uniref:Secreted protein n=1 Tax=Apostasia shenzhenica TaxID=1088818 RepID=A0A2I0BD22_9ASPA|nr:hypothetical protein AXF42_Ash013105 [Apostasia shenzhenica]
MPTDLQSTRPFLVLFSHGILLLCLHAAARKHCLQRPGRAPKFITGAPAGGSDAEAWGSWYHGNPPTQLAYGCCFNGEGYDRAQRNDLRSRRQGFGKRRGERIDSILCRE